MRRSDHLDDLLAVPVLGAPPPTERSPRPPRKGMPPRPPTRVFPSSPPKSAPP